MTTVRVLVADDDPLVREYLRTVLSAEPDLDVVATAADGAAAVEAGIAHTPQVALLDVRMPGVDGIVATRALRELDPPVAVVLITTLDTDAVLVDGLAAGAAGFVVKTAEPALLASAALQSPFSWTWKPNWPFGGSPPTTRRAASRPSPSCT